MINRPSQCIFLGCTDSTNPTYDPMATFDDDTCLSMVVGCTDQLAVNFVSEANADDGSCVYAGCTDSTSFTYNPSASVDSGRCPHPFFGCTDPAAANYFSVYTRNDGSCSYGGCTDPVSAAYNPSATWDDGSCSARRRLAASTCLDPSASNFGGSPPCLYLIMGCTNSLALNYMSFAQADPTGEDECIFPILGCTMPDAFNYDSVATVLTTCIDVRPGCLDSAAKNYDPAANTELTADNAKRS